MPIEILGVGEVLWDMLPTGRALGGAPANFIFHCRRLGHEAALVSRVGTDPLGEEMLTSLTERGLDPSLVQRDAAHPTGTVDVALVGGQPAYTIHENVAWDHLQPDDALDALLANALVVCFGTLMQRHPVSRASVQRLVRMASQQALVVCDINLRQEYWSAEVIEQSLKLSRWAKLNDEELGKLASLFDLRGETESERLLSLRRRFGLELAALTRGARGALVQTDDEEATVAGERVEVADTVGAGDAFTAGLVCGVLEGMSISDAAWFANRYAARVAGAVGGMPLVERP